LTLERSGLKKIGPIELGAPPTFSTKYSNFNVI
jgi:hypothetical protein